MLTLIIGKVERLAKYLAYMGAVIIVVQVLWVSYGVMMRYVFAAPDGMVTEATALLLFPVAFLGLAYALKENAYPRVHYLIECTSGTARKIIGAVNYGLMGAVSGFFSYAVVNATIRSFNSGASSEILLWPRYAFFAPGAVALVVLTIYVGLRLLALFLGPEKTD